MVGKPPRMTVRTVAVVAVAALMVTAGCVGSLTGSDGNGTQDGATDAPGQGTPDVGDVPAKAEMIASYDADVVTDDTTQAVVNAYLEQVIPKESNQPRTVDAILDEAKKQASGQTNLSMSAVGGATMFVDYPSRNATMGAGPMAVTEESQYFGIILNSEWSEKKVISLIRKQSETSLTEETYKGTTIYTPTDTSTQKKAGLAKYGDGKWVFGTMAAVKDVVDVANGNADAVGGELQQVYQSTPSDAYVRFAAVVPKEYRQAMDSGIGRQAPSMGSLSASTFSNVTAVAGSYYTEGGKDGTVGMSMKMRFANANSATKVGNQASGLLSLAQGSVSNETIKTQLDAIEVSAEGKTVTMGYESSVGDIRTMMEQFLNYPYGMGMGMGMGAGGQSVSQRPTAGFAFDSSNGEVSVTVTSIGGDIDGSKVVAQCGGMPVEVPNDFSVGTTFTASNCEPGTTLTIVYKGSKGGVLARYEIPGQGTSSDGQYDRSATAVLAR